MTHNYQRIWVVDIRLHKPTFHLSPVQNTWHVRDRSEVHGSKGQDKFDTNLKINEKTKKKEQKFGIHELLYKTGAGSGAPEG